MLHILNDTHGCHFTNATVKLKIISYLQLIKQLFSLLCPVRSLKISTSLRWSWNMHCFSVTKMTPVRSIWKPEPIITVRYPSLPFCVTWWSTAAHLSKNLLDCYCWIRELPSHPRNRNWSKNRNTLCRVYSKVVYQHNSERHIQLQQVNAVIHTIIWGN